MAESKTPPPDGTETNPNVGMDVKLALAIGDSFSLELAKNKLADGAPEAVALLASRSLQPIGREAQTLIPNKSPMDDKLATTFKSLGGRKEFGDTLAIDSEGIFQHQLVLGISPRDTLRRDETKEVLLKIVYNLLRLGLQDGRSVVHFEATDGNTIFSIPRPQIAEVYFDACWYFGLKYPSKKASVRFCSSSKTLLETYSKVFQKRYEKLSQELLAAGEISEENPTNNFMLDTLVDESDWIKTYGMYQRQLYNDTGSITGVDLYDAFVACERRFGRPKNPITLTQIKSYLRDIQNATELQLNTIVQRRQKECQKVVVEALEKHKLAPVEFFRNLCVYNLQFCKEILVKTIREITVLENNFLPPSQLSKMLHRYAAEENAESTEESETTRQGASRTASEIYIAKSGGKRRSQSRAGPPKRKSSKAPRMDGALLRDPNADGASSSAPGSPSASPAPVEEIEIDQFAVLKERCAGQPLAPNYQKVLEALYSGNYRLVNLAFDIVQIADADKMSTALVRIFHYNDDALAVLKLAIKNEVDKTQVLSTLFRQNSIASKMLGTFARLVSKNYLMTVLKPCIQKVLEAKDGLEVDPSKLQPGSDIRANQQQLKSITDLLINDIRKSVDLLPYPVRAICAFLKETVEAKFSDGGNVAIAGFLVLRLINPVVTVPDSLGLLSPEKSAEARRGLLFVSKLIQNLANQVDFKKEEFMLTFNSYVTEKFALMEDFFLECAAPCEPKDTDKNASWELTVPQLNESFVTVCKQFALTKDKYLPLLEMDQFVLEDFKAMLANPAEEAIAGLVAPAPAASPAAPANGAVSEKDKKEKDKKEKEKQKEKEKEEKKKAEKEKEEKKKAEKASKEKEKKK